MIATYGPTPNTDPNATDSMWQRQLKLMEKLPPLERMKDPREQYQFDLQNHIQHLKGAGYEVILLGDTNINLLKDNTTITSWKDQMWQAGLHNILDAWWPQLGPNRTTWKVGTNTSACDQIYTSTPILQSGAIREVGIRKQLLHIKTDHYMIGMSVNFTRLLGRVEGLPTLYKPRPRYVKASIKHDKESYRETAEARDHAHKAKQNGSGLRAWINPLTLLAQTTGWNSTGQ